MPSEKSWPLIVEPAVTQIGPRTSELAELVVRVLGREKIAGRHAATRTFQALRMHLNDELGELARGLGFGYVASGPLVRSSYRAGELYLEQRLRGA